MKRYIIKNLRTERYFTGFQHDTPLFNSDPNEAVTFNQSELKGCANKIYETMRDVLVPVEII
jgi:hypothetical protein